MAVVAIDNSSPHLDAVKKLWRVHSDTLGFLPDGAFNDYAKEGHVLVALAGSDCVGYLLYRTVRDRVAIAHFCIAQEARKQGHARALLNHLVNSTQHLRGVGLYCRRDFEQISKAWQRLGFSAVMEKPGRAADGSDLVYWWMGHEHKNLFDTPDNTNRLQVVIDHNVVLDLVQNQQTDSHGLRADWIQPFIRLCHTPEHLNEVLRINDSSTRKKRRAELQQFDKLEVSNSKYQQAESVLKPLFHTLTCEQDESDFRHVIWALAVEADAFVTRDDSLLDRASGVFDACGLRIVRPADLIVDIDVLLRERDYQRSYIAGTLEISQQLIGGSDDSLIEKFLAPGERKNVLKATINRCLSEPQRFRCQKITDSGVTVGLYVVERESGTDRVPTLRICDNRRAGSLTRALLTGIVRQAVKDNIKAVFVTESNLSEIGRMACSDLGFLSVQGGWVKLVLSGWLPINAVPALLTWNDPKVDELKATLPAACNDAFTASQLEHLLWPAKLADAALPCFIVPIHPQYAEHLVDERLTRGGLLGADVDLALNPESAYYRAAKPAVLKCPGRVLWYVTENDIYQGTKAIRACSRIVELVMDCPKPLFKRFQRLGVYEWRNVFETAGRNIEQPIMAFRFDDSELLRPMAWERFQEILEKHDNSHPLQSPAEISPQAFGEIYVASLDSPKVC
jgi:ribosomal protein S18 acetylase RimI-like enzyme/predicted nucleic acid-binding protein